VYIHFGPWSVGSWDRSARPVWSLVVSVFSHLGSVLFFSRLRSADWLMKGSWPWSWPWIWSYCTPSCITYRPLGLHTCQISLKSKKLFGGRTNVKTHVRTYGRLTDDSVVSKTFFEISRPRPRQWHWILDTKTEIWPRSLSSCRMHSIEFFVNDRWPWMTAPQFLHFALPYASS